MINITSLLVPQTKIEFSPNKGRLALNPHPCVRSWIGVLTGRKGFMRYLQENVRIAHGMRFCQKEICSLRVAPSAAGSF